MYVCQIVALNRECCVQIVYADQDQSSYYSRTCYSKQQVITLDQKNNYIGSKLKKQKNKNESENKDENRLR